jgi:myosin-5
MGKVGIPAEQREAVFATVAAVLHLGNISFVEGKEADSSKVAPGLAQEHLQAAGAAVDDMTWQLEVHAEV